MDDTEDDDARYPPNRRPSSFSHRSNAPPIAQPKYADADDEDDDEDVDHATNDPGDEYAAGRRRIRDADPSSSSSSESRGKRQRLHKYALGFEFAPRAAVKPPAPPAPPPPPPAAARNTPGEWSEDSTFVLLDTWGDLYLQNGRKAIRSDDWGKVAKRVCRDSKIVRSESQCRNRLDTLKKKYRKEMARMAAGGDPNSNWVYFKKLDALMRSPSPPPPPPLAVRQLKPPRLPCGVNAGEYGFASSRGYRNRSNGADEMRDGPGDTGSEENDDGDEDELDSPPPRRESLLGSSESSFRMLANSIEKFGEIYEKTENSKRQQMAELQRMRKEFHRDLEVKKRQILERAQVEIAKIWEEMRGDDQEEEERSEEDEGNDDGIDVST